MIDPLGIKKNDPLGLKKKVDSKPLSQEELWGSDSQPQDLYTSLATGAQEPQQESDGLGGPPKMKTFTGLTPEEQQTLQAKPAIKVSKSVELTSKRLKLQNELSKTKVTPENQAEISRKTDELSSIVKEQDKIGKTRLSELEQQFKSSKDENSANAEAEERLNNLITKTGVWNNVKSTSIDVYNSVVDELSALTDEVGIKELKADTDPLSEEKNKVIKDALKKKIRLDENQINEEAKKLYKEKQVESIETDRINSFLDDLDDDDKNLLKQDRYNRSVHLQEDNVKQEKIINAYEVVGNKKIKEYQDIENELLNFKSQNKEVPKELYDSYINLGFEIKGISNSISKRQKLLQKNKEDLGDVNQEFDFFKRQYGDVENFLLNTGTMARKLAVNTLGGLNYVGSLGGIIGDKNLGVQKDVIRINAEIDDQRDRLRKSVETIESPEGFVNYVSDVMSNQIPSLVVTSTGAGGLAAIGVSTAGEKYADMNKEVLEGKATYSPLQMASVPFLYGAAEVVSEIPTVSILKKGGRLLESITKNEADLITKSVKQKAKEWAKDWSVDTGKEIAGEEFTNFAQNFTDKYVLGKKDVGLLDNAGTVLKDTFTLTSILKAAPHVAGAILKPHQTNEDLLILDDNSRKIIEFSNQIDSNVLSDKEKAVVTKQMNKLVAKNSEIIANTIDKVDNMPVDVYKKVIELNDKAANIKSEAVTINDGVLPNKNDLLKELSVEYKSVRDQRNAFLNIKYQAPAVEEVKPAEEPTIKDSQIPLKRETFEFESAEGDILDVQVTTRKDGSRDFVAKDKDGRIVSSQKVGKDNTLTTEEYVTKGYGDIQGESKLEQGNDIMAPAMKDKLTPEQKKELGITEEPAVEEVTPAVEEVTPAEVAVEYNGTEYTKNEYNNWVNTKTGNEVKGIGDTGKELIKTLDDLSIPKTQAEQYSEELDKTKESDPEAYWSVSPVSAADAAKGTIIDTPDGAAIVKPDGDIAGLFKKATSKAKGVAQDLLKRAVAAGGKKLDNFDTYLTPQYIKAGFRVVSRTPFNEEYAPPGWNKELHGTPDVVAMVYDPENKLDIEEKTFNDYDEAIAYRDSILEIDAELEGLAKLFDESEKGFRESQVDNAKEALKGILPGVEFIVHETNEAYKKATGESGSGGMYIYSSGGDKVIHINKQKANGRTVAHEVFHAVILDKIKGDKAVQEITARMVDAVYKTASPELRSELDAFAARYTDKTIRDEERLAELIGIIADGYPKMSPANKSIVKRWLDALAKTFGFKPFTDNEVIDLLNTLAGKISTGEVISAEDVAIFKGGKKVNTPSDGLTKRFQYGNDKVKLEITYLEQDRVEELKEKGLLIEPENLSGLNGKKVVTTSPDDMLVGSIFVNGKEVATGNGGVYFVTKFGDVWANSNKAVANGLAKAINETFDPVTGKSYLALVKGTDAKLVSSPQGVTSSLAVTESMIDAGLFSLSDFRSAVRSAVKSSGGSISLSPNGSAKVLKSEVDNFFKDVTSSTFEKRGNVLRDIVSNLAKSESAKTNKTEIIKFLNGDESKGLGVGKTEKSQSLIDLIATTSAEKLTKGLNTGDVYAVIEIDGKVKVVQDSHQSYPYHIKIVDENGNISNKKPVLILPKNRRNGKEILTSVDGKTAKELGTAFSGKVGATANMPYGKGIIMDDSVSTIKRSQLTEGKVDTVSESFFNDADKIFPNDHILGGYAVTDYKGKLIGRVKLSEVNDNTVKIDEVVSEKKGERTGNGSAIMKMVVDNADKNNTKLTLTANLILGIKAKGFETAKKLQSFYEKFGFVKGSNGLMTREPVIVKKLQQANTIEDMVRIAKEAKYSDAAISAFLKTKGFSDAEITSALATDRPSVNKIYEDSKKAIDDKKKRVSIKDLAPFLRKSLLDRQAYIKRVINRIDNKSAKKAYDLLVTKAGASALASERFKRAEKKIYGGLSSEDVSTLDKIIYAKRMVAVNESRAKLGLEPYKGMDGYSIDDANRDLADFKSSLGDKKFNDLSNRATEYFDVFKLNLKKLYESGRISEETYESLKDTEYSPIKTIKYIIGDNLSVDEIDTQAKSLGISRNDIMKLSDNNENEIILDSKWLLAMSINSVEGRAFENNMLREFDKAIKEATPEEKKAFEDIILDNPVVGTKKDGGLKYKYDDTRLPVGYTKVSYFNDGNKVEIVLKDQYAKQLLDVKNKNKALETLGKLTGTKILRFFATGGNPLFIIGNTAVDFQNIAFFSDVYSKFKPMATAQLARDYTKNFVKKLFVSNEYNKVFNEYINHGGALDYMASDGLRSLESMNPVKGVTKAVQKGLIAYGRAMSLLGETSEVAFRLSVFQKVKEDSIKEFKKENNREPNAQELDDIMWNAGRQSRETMDFSQGGDVAKNIDAVFPYFNAALQGIRRPIDFAKKDPVGFSSSVLQYTVMASSLAAGSFAMLINAVGGDDDEDRAKKIMDAMNSLSEYEKANYHIMFTGEKNKDGEYEYYRVKKLPVLSVISTVAEQLIYKEFFNSKGIDYDMDSKVMLEAVNKSNPLPVTVQEVAGKNPVASGLVSYWANKDTFTGDKIFREPNNKKILPEAEGMFDDRVDQIYKDLAPGFGLSPARTKVMVEKVITSANTNPTIPLIYSAYDGLFNKSDGLGSEVKEAMSGVGDAFGKKVVRYTDKKIIRYKDQDEKEYQESLLETKVWNSEQKVYNEIKKKYDGGGNLTKKELIDLVKENFEPMDYMKYAKKYNAYIHNMNIDKSVLDIIFEDVPEVQAMKLNQRYGPNLEGEELKELGRAMNSAGKRINNKSIYIYNKKYKNRNKAQ
jgi:predicted GNAT family N-acyltransferase